MLYALPGTQLTRRLAREGRLHDTFDRVDDSFDGGDQCTAGLNYDTSRPLLDILRDFREIRFCLAHPGLGGGQFGARGVDLSFGNNDFRHVEAA